MMPDATRDSATMQRMLDSEQQLRAMSGEVERPGRRGTARDAPNSRCVPLCFTGPLPCDVIACRYPDEEEVSSTRRVSAGAATPAASTTNDSWFGWAVYRLSLGVQQPKDPRLLQAHVVFRHGQRTPCEAFFADDEPFWRARVGVIEDKSGVDIDSARLNARDASKALESDERSWRKQMLTCEGWEAALELGRKLRRKYYGLLGAHPELAVDARATDTVRTQLSAQAVLEGLVPGANMAKKVYCARTWSSLNGQQRAFDKLLISPGPFAEKLMASMASHGDIRDVLEGHADLKQNERFLRESLKVADQGKSFQFDPETVSVFLLGDSLSQRRAHGGGLPPGISAPLAHSLEMYFEDSFDRCVSNRASAMEAHGPIVRDIFTCMKQDATGRKLFLYGAHDLSLLSMLRVLCVFPKPYPDSLICLNFEVYDWKNRLYLRLTYANRDATIPCVKYETTPKGIKMCLLQDVENLIFRT